MKINPLVIRRRKPRCHRCWSGWSSGCHSSALQLFPKCFFSKPRLRGARRCSYSEAAGWLRYMALLALPYVLWWPGTTTRLWWPNLSGIRRRLRATRLAAVWMVFARVSEMQIFLSRCNARACFLVINIETQDWKKIVTALMLKLWG
jgi:hypothetical protein